MPKVIQVIESEITRGSGDSEHDPIHIVKQYHTPDGEFLAEHDSESNGVPMFVMQICDLLDLSIKTMNNTGRTRDLSICEMLAHITDEVSDIVKPTAADELKQTLARELSDFIESPKSEN